MPFDTLHRKVYLISYPIPRQGILMSAHKKREDVIKRLTRIEGHVRGVRRMVEEDKGCPEVLLQLAAVRAALNKVGRLVFEDHVETCISKAIKEGEGKSAVAGLKEALARFL